MTQETKISNPQPMAARLAELSDMADRALANEPGGGWLARAIRDRIIAKLEENRSLGRTVAQDIEAVLTSGLTGPHLTAELWARFSKASRADVFFGVVMAITIMEARATLAETEMAIMQMERAA